VGEEVRAGAEEGGHDAAELGVDDPVDGAEQLVEVGPAARAVGQEALRVESSPLLGGVEDRQRNELREGAQVWSPKRGLIEGLVDQVYSEAAKAIVKFGRFVVDGARTRMMIMDPDSESQACHLRVRYHG
jgi:hypothetical protein